MKITFNPSTVAALTTPPNNKDITFDLRGRNIFARGVKFYGTDTNTWRDIKINNVSIGSHTLDLQNGSNTTLTNTNGVVTINSTWRPVVDNLTSDSTTSSLSAKQGRVLKALIDGKSDSDHNHDGRYLRLSGQDTMQGNLYLHSHGTSYIGKGLGDKSGADFTEANIVIRSWWGISFKSYDDIVRTYIDTRTGNIGTKGVLNAVGAVIQGRVYNGGDDEGIIINPASNGYAGLILGTHNGERSVFYLKKGNPFWRYNNGSTNLDIQHPKKSGVIALTSDIPSKDSWNYDDRYLRLTGGWMSGDINFGGDNKIHWGRNTDSASISFKNDGDGDANSYMSFVTSDNGNEYFRWSHDADSTNTEWMALRSDGLRVRGIKVSLEGHTHDDRYYTKAESNAKYITDITTSVNKLTFTKNGSNIIRDITVNVVHSQGHLTDIPNKDATTKASPGLLIYNSYEQTIGTNSYSSVLSINTGGTIQIAGNWGDDQARNLYWRSQSDRKVADYPWKSWRTILDSENYSSTLDSRYYTESEVNSLLSRKLDRVNLTTGSWNPRGWNLAADYCYNGGDLSISENNGKMYVSVNGCFWQNEGQYRVLDTSDVGDIRNSVTLHQYLSATDVAWYPLVWGGNSHHNTSDSTGAVYKSYDKLSWQTSSQTLYATNIQTNNIKNLSIGGGIYWNPYVEAASDGSDAASITLVRSGVAGGTTLVLSQMNDTNDTIQFKTNTAARLYHNNYPILTTQNTYVSNNKGYIYGNEITQVNNSDKVDNRHAISTTPNTGIIYKAAIYTISSLTSYWVRLASISSINQNGEFVATIHVQSGHFNPGRSAILLVYLRGDASSFMSKSFKICCNSNYNPDRFRLYYKDSDKTSEIWYQTTGQWDGIITTVISQSAEGQLYEGLTLYSGNITAVQTPSVSTYLSAQVSTITDNISGNASTATKLQTPRTIWGQSFDGTGNVSGFMKNVKGLIHGDSLDEDWSDGNNTHPWYGIDYRHCADSTETGKAYTSISSYFGLYFKTGGQRFIFDGGNVGIGTNSPAYKLHVVGDIYTTTGFKKNGSSDSYVLLGGGGHKAESSLRVAYASNADMVDGYHENSFLRYRGATNTDQEATLWSQIGIKQYNNALPDNLTGVYNYGSVISLPGFNSRFEIYASHQSSIGNGLYYRSGWNSDKKTWLKFIDSSNIGSQTVANAYHLRINSANTWSTWYWAGQSSQPSWLWGSNDGTNMYVWNPSNFNVNTAQYLRSLGNQNCQTGRTQAYGDVYSYNTYNGNTGSPTTYSSVIGFGRGIAGTVEIAGGWCNTHLYWRSLRDCCEDWFPWRTVLDSSNYTEFINNYYWANVKISASSSTTTSPTVSNLTATSSIRMGNILLEHTDEINNSANGGIHLNYRNSGKVSLCQGGGSVGIGTTSPTQKLDVHGNIRATGQLYLPTKGNYNAILMGDDCWMGDCNISNVIGLSGTNNANSGGIKFGKGGMYIGYNGSNHYSSGTSLWTNFNADTVDGEHASNFSYTHQSSFDFYKIKSGRIVTFDQLTTKYGWINGFASTYNNYLTSVIFNTHRTSNWYVGYMEGDTSTGETLGLKAVHKLAFADGDANYSVFLGYLNLYNGDDGTISSSFSCLGYSVPFTYTRGGGYCFIHIPDTSSQWFFIKAAIASVHYSGTGMDQWVGSHRGAGAWWLHCNVMHANAVQVKGFRLGNGHNDSWWGGNPLYSGDNAAKIITVCLFGYVIFR